MGDSIERLELCIELHCIRGFRPSIESVASTATGAVKSSLVSQASSISAAAASKASEVSARISSGVADATGTGSPTSSSTAGAAVMTAAPIWGAAIGAALYWCFGGRIGAFHQAFSWACLLRAQNCRLYHY